MLTCSDIGGNIVGPSGGVDITILVHTNLEVEVWNDGFIAL